MQSLANIKNMIGKLLNDLEKNIEEENYEKVIEIIDSIILLNPDLTTPLLLKKAETLIELEEYEKAIFLLEKYLTECENCKEFDVYSDLADCYFKLENLEKEEECLLKAYELKSENYVIIKKLVYYYFLNDMPQKCIDFVEKLIEEGKADFEDYSNLIYSHLNLNNIDKAIEYSNDIIKFDPSYVDAYVTLTIAYEMAEDYEKLKETHERIIALEDDGTEQLTLLKSQSYVELGREKEAIETVDKVIRTTPYNPFGYIMRGMLYQKLNKQKEAQECFSEAYKLEPTILKKMIKKWNSLNNI